MRHLTKLIFMLYY